MRGASSKLSIWSRAILALLLSATMRAMWILPLLDLVLGSRYVQPSGVRYPFGLALGVLLGGAVLAELWRERPAGPYLGAVTGLVISFGSVILLRRAPGGVAGGALPRLLSRLFDLREAIPAELVLLLGSAGLWYAGLKSGWQSHQALWRSFLAGTLVLSMLMLIQLGGPAASEGSLTGRVLGFSLSGLLALALLGSRHVRDPLQGDRAAPAGLNRYWLMTVSLVILLVVILGWALGKIVSPQAVRDIWGALRPIWGTLVEGLRLILVAIVYGLAWLLRPLFGLLTRDQAVLQEFQLAPPQEFQPFGEEPGALAGLPPLLRTGLGVAAGLAILAGLVALFVWAWRRRPRAPTDEGYLEERDSIWSLKLLGEQLQSLLRRRLGGLPQPPYLDLVGLDDRRRAVRRLYQSLLSGAAARGWPRLAGQTPSAYARVLAQRLPRAGDALDRLTDAYAQVRYGARAPTPQQVAQALAAWEEIEGVLRDKEPPEAAPRL